jgi:hypothetical protein
MIDMLYIQFAVRTHGPGPGRARGIGIIAGIDMIDHL